MPKFRAASNTTTLSFFRRVLRRSAHFGLPQSASRSMVGSSSEPTATVPRSEEYARSPSLAPKHPEWEEDSPNWIMGPKQSGAWGWEKSWWLKYPLKQLAAREPIYPLFVEPVTGYGPSRVVSHLAEAAWLEAESAIGYEPSLFSVDQVPPSVLDN